MKAAELIGIGLFTMAAVFTAYMWSERLRRSNPLINEAFEDMTPAMPSPAMDMPNLDNIQMGGTPSSQDASKAYKLLLKYIQSDFTHGIKFVTDFGDKFYDRKLPLRSDLDVRKLMDNYRDPLQR